MTRASEPRSQTPRRQQAAARRQAELRRERRRRGVLLGGLAVLVLAVVGGLVALGVSSNRSPTTSPTPVPGVRTFPEDRGHTSAKVTYPQTPPAGGAHNPIWLNCGTYDQPVPNENAVHGLEHGAVWITYRPDLPATDVAALRTLAREQGDYTTLSPYPNLPSPVVASAWGAQLTVDDARDLRLRQFLTQYRLSPQAPEPGAPCSGGIGTPAP